MRRLLTAKQVGEKLGRSANFLKTHEAELKSAGFPGKLSISCLPLYDEAAIDLWLDNISSVNYSEQQRRNEIQDDRAVIQARIAALSNL